MNLKHLTDKTLLSELKRISRQEREITTNILHHIKEVEKRKLFSDLKYSSMLEYLIKDLGYSEGAASRRLQSARMLQEIPELEKKIEDGSLSLSNLNKAAGFFRKEDIKDPNAKKEILEKIENQSARECEKTLFSLGKNPVLPTEGVKIVSRDYQQIKVNVSDSTFELIEKARKIMGHYTINEKFLKELSTEAIENFNRKKFKLTEKGRCTESNSRIPSNSQRREVFQQSNGVCENCGSIFMTQIDHIEAYSLNGKTSGPNLRLLCFHCNQRARIRAKL